MGDIKWTSLFSRTYPKGFGALLAAEAEETGAEASTAAEFPNIRRVIISTEGGCESEWCTKKTLFVRKRDRMRVHVIA